MSIIHRFQDGGVFMYFILVLGVVSFGLIFERYYSLYRKGVKTYAGLRAQLLSLMSRGDYASAAQYAQTLGSNPVAKIARIGCELRVKGCGDEEIQARMDEALNAEVNQIDQRTGFLATFGNVATLLGLLGTLSGMITSFAAVASANPADRATMLSLGISEAMNCTAFGLIVAIPALLAYAFFQNRTDQAIHALTAETTTIFHDLIFLTEGETNPVKASSAHRSAPSANLSQ